MAAPMDSPWLTASEAALYTRRGARYLRKQVKNGKLRAAVVGGRSELLYHREWLDEFLENQTKPALIKPAEFFRRRRPA
jgi:excisionase family DNA binding protein